MYSEMRSTSALNLVTSSVQLWVDAGVRAGSTSGTGDAEIRAVMGRIDSGLASDFDFSAEAPSSSQEAKWSR